MALLAAAGASEYFEEPTQQDALFMYFFHAGGDSLGWNWGEGCWLVDGKLYAAFAKGIVGEPEGKRSAAHHILFEPEAKINHDWPLQWWVLSGKPPHPPAESQPIPPVPEDPYGIA